MALIWTIVNPYGKIWVEPFEQETRNAILSVTAVTAALLYTVWSVRMFERALVPLNVVAFSHRQLEGGVRRRSSMGPNFISRLARTRVKEKAVRNHLIFYLHGVDQPGDAAVEAHERADSPDFTNLARDGDTWESKEMEDFITCVRKERNWWTQLAREDHLRGQMRVALSFLFFCLVCPSLAFDDNRWWMVRGSLDIAETTTALRAAETGKNKYKYTHHVATSSNGRGCVRYGLVRRWYALLPLARAKVAKAFVSEASTNEDDVTFLASILWTSLVPCLFSAIVLVLFQVVVVFAS
jgi:hypothetical protein